MFSSTKKVLNPPAPGSKSWSFRLGDEVKDKVNGLTGIALSRNYHLTGCDTFIVELPAADGKPGETMNVSAERLELVTSHPDRHIDEIPHDDVNLGDVARDVTTGICGVVSVVSVPLFGTTRVCIEPGFNDREKKMGDAWMVDTNVVEVTKPLNPVAMTKGVEPVPTPAKPKRDGACRLPRNF